jgi:hypothetical protein
MDLEQRASDERQKWEKPYVFEPYPKMLYRGLPVPPGWEHCTVDNEREEREQKESGAGWFEKLADAIKHQEQLGADIGLAAAERAAADRKMSAKAQAEAAAADKASDGHHLGEIPEKSHRPVKKTLRPEDQPPKKDA